jgi:hypothetical protein
MEKRTPAPFQRRDRAILAVIGVALIVSTILFVRSDRAHDWRFYQAEFQRRVAAKFGAAKAATVRSGLQQVWVPELQRADRCIVCHQATQWKGFEDAEEPYRTHPEAILRTHPVERYGCTSCHGGQGFAIDAPEAHGPVAFWEEPLLSRARSTAWPRRARCCR